MTIRTVVVSGATGLIGSLLTTALAARGYRVRRLVRNGGQHAPLKGDIPWNPRAGQLDSRELEGADAIVNLAGESIAQRWNSHAKNEIRESRIRATSLLAEGVASLTARPKVFLSGSAVGYYGACGDQWLTESSAPGSGFLAEVAQEWETAARSVELAGVRLVLLRTGIVLSPKGGALEKLLAPFKLGVGGPIGSGTQWMSWISLRDQVRAMIFALESDIEGPVNLVAPAPVRNAEFAAALGHALHRPAMIRTPAFAVRLLLGQMGEETVLQGQRVKSDALMRHGFAFDDATLTAALARELS